MWVVYNAMGLTQQNFNQVIDFRVAFLFVPGRRIVQCWFFQSWWWCFHIPWPWSKGTCTLHDSLGLVHWWSIRWRRSRSMRHLRVQWYTMLRCRPMPVCSPWPPSPCWQCLLLPWPPRLFFSFRPLPFRSFPCWAAKESCLSIPAGWYCSSGPASSFPSLFVDLKLDRK